MHHEIMIMSRKERKLDCLKINSRKLLFFLSFLCFEETTGQEEMNKK